MAESSNSQIFVQYYNKIEKYLEEISEVKGHSPFWILLKEAGKRNRIVREFEDDLNEFSKLRNAIVHSSTNKTMAEPTQEALNDIINIYNTLIKPPTAGEVFNKPVLTCSLEDNLFQICALMAKNDYTQVPIYDNSEFKGLVTEQAVVKWISAHCGEGQCERFEDVTVRGILPYTSGQFYRFIASDLDVYTILDYFLEFVERTERLECVLITKTGNKNEIPIGIVTTWDVPLIKKYFRD